MFTYMRPQRLIEDKTNLQSLPDIWQERAMVPGLFVPGGNWLRAKFFMELPSISLLVSRSSIPTQIRPSRVTTLCLLAPFLPRSSTMSLEEMPPHNLIPLQYQHIHSCLEYLKAYHSCKTMQESRTKEQQASYKGKFEAALTHCITGARCKNSLQVGYVTQHERISSHVAKMLDEVRCNRENILQASPI